jgi:hypothetical protein
MPHNRPTMNNPRSIKVVVASADRTRWTFAWSMKSHLTSFYVTPLGSGLETLKISLHGPDPRHGKPGYKVELMAPPEGASRPPVLVKRFNWPDKVWFSGHRVAADVDMVLRLRFTHDLFDRHVSRAPNLKSPKPGDDALHVPAPEVGYATDIDIFACHRAAFWPNEQKARADNACFGPLENSAGQFMTAEAVHRRVEETPSPVSSPALGRVGNIPLAADQVRTVGGGFDGNEVLWLQEMLVRQSSMHPSFSMFAPPEPGP